MQRCIEETKSDSNIVECTPIDPESDPCLAPGVDPADDPLILQPVGENDEPNFQPIGIATTMDDISYFTPEIREVPQPTVENSLTNSADFDSYLTQVVIMISLMISQLELNVNDTNRVEPNPVVLTVQLTAPKLVTLGDEAVCEYTDEFTDAVLNSQRDRIEGDSLDSPCKVKHQGTRYQHNVINKRGEKVGAKQPKTVLCVICGRYVQSQVHLKRHVETVHDGLRPYICTLSHEKETLKAFKRKDHLSKHLRTVHNMDETEIKEYIDGNYSK